MTLENVTSAGLASKSAKLLRKIAEIRLWLGGRDSNPDTVVQSHVSYRWTTSQSGAIKKFRIQNSEFQVRFLNPNPSCRISQATLGRSRLGRAETPIISAGPARQQATPANEPS